MNKVRRCFLTAGVFATTVLIIYKVTLSSLNPVQKQLYLTAMFTGRLGNQMFVYATMLGLARTQNRTPFVSDAGNLNNIFQITLINKGISTTGWRVIEESKYATFDSMFMNLPEVNVTLKGYLQCWKYFHLAGDEIRREFTLSPTLQNYSQSVLAKYRSPLDKTVLVGVHVRRGDILTPDQVQFGIRAARASYFTKAFSKMRSLLPNQNITFLVASEDLDWCKNNLIDSSVRFLPPGSASEHFTILSSCDHVIMTGGTYGWWSAWLANGITIYNTQFMFPNSKVRQGLTDVDYYLPGWIGLEN